MTSTLTLPPVHTIAPAVARTLTASDLRSLASRQAERHGVHITMIVSKAYGVSLHPFATHAEAQAYTLTAGRSIMVQDTAVLSPPAHPWLVHVTTKSGTEYTIGAPSRDAARALAAGERAIGARTRVAKG